METCLETGNAPSVYLIEEVTGSIPVAPIETFKRTLLWSIEASSALQMLALTKKNVSGRFETVAQYLDESEAEDALKQSP